MKKFSLLLLSCLLLLFALAGCSTNENAQQKVSQKKTELTISAAASLQDALNEIQASFEKDHQNVKLSFNYGASGALQQQISQGAPVDLFFSAAEDKFAKLEHDGFIKKSDGKDLLGNELVLVVPKGSTKGINSFDDLTKADKVALGTPESVPAGQYAKQTLENQKIWNAVEGKVVYGKDVRQVLTYVETNNVDAGIVYQTDALTSSKVKVVAVAGENTHDSIIYPVGIIKNSSHLKQAREFYDYLQSQKSMKIFKKYGFKGLK